MIEWLIRTSLDQRVIVLLGAVGLCVGGLFAFRSVPIDAFPDVTPVQVQVITRAPSLAPPEIELFHKRAALRREIETAADETTRRSLQQQLSEVEQMIALRLEAMRVSGRI